MKHIAKIRCAKIIVQTLFLSFIVTFIFSCEADVEKCFPQTPVVVMTVNNDSSQKLAIKFSKFSELNLTVDPDSKESSRCRDKNPSPNLSSDSNFLWPDSVMVYAIDEEETLLKTFPSSSKKIELTERQHDDFFNQFYCKLTITDEDLVTSE